MWMKVVIVAFLLLILYFLGSGLYHLLHDRSAPRQMVKALSWRIGLSVGIFVLLLIAFSMGWITPHGLS